MELDPDIMATVPKFLEGIDPWVEYNKNILLDIQAFSGLPWEGIIVLASMLMRLTLLPVFYVQYKRT